MRQQSFVYSLAQIDNLFYVDAAAAVGWTNRVLCSNMSYFRLRRELFEEFNRLLSAPDGRARCAISPEVFIVIRYFLTARNDVLDDNKRLSFDKAILQLRSDAYLVLHPVAAAPRGVVGFLGLGG